MLTSGIEFTFLPFKFGHKMVDVICEHLPRPARFQQTIILVGLDPGLRCPQSTRSVERNHHA